MLCQQDKPPPWEARAQESCPCWLKLEKNPAAMKTLYSQKLKKWRKEKKKKNKKSFLKSSGVILFESPGSALSHLGQGDQREFGLSVQGSCSEQQGMLCFQDGSLGDDRFLILASWALWKSPVGPRAVQWLVEGQLSCVPGGIVVMPTQERPLGPLLLTRKWFFFFFFNDFWVLVF